MSDDRTEPSHEQTAVLQDLEPALAKMEADVLAGLRRKAKSLPSQYLYNARGAQLFAQICEQPEYYLTRTEAAIMQSNMASIAQCIGPNALVIEPGSGEGRKSKILLSGLTDPAGYMPIDISRDQLLNLAREVSQRFPGIEVIPICADFTDDLDLLDTGHRGQRCIVFLPGSTIGNFHPAVAIKLLRNMKDLAGKGGGILIGVDLKKNAAILEPAYDDAAGVSRDFAMNYLTRLNDECGTDLDLDAFAYQAPFNETASRIEMSLVSLKAQCMHIGDHKICFEAGELIRTELSYKFDLSDFVQVAAKAGLRVAQVWTDPDDLFSVQFLVPT